MDVKVKGPRAVDYDGKIWPPGETIPGMDDKEAQRLIDKGIVEKAKAESSEMGEIPPEGDLTVKQIKEQLEDMGVEIPPGAKKPELAALLEEALKVA